VGVWEPDFETGNFHIGAKINWNELINRVNGNMSYRTGEDGDGVKKIIGWFKCEYPGCSVV